MRKLVCEPIRIGIMALLVAVVLLAGVTILVPAKLAHAASSCHVLHVVLHGNEKSTSTCLVKDAPITPSTNVTVCGNNLVTPWIALYSGRNYGGSQICFTGYGFVNLRDYWLFQGFVTWENEARSVNEGANGYAWWGANATVAVTSIHYGFQTGDLGIWDMHYASLMLDS